MTNTDEHPHFVNEPPPWEDDPGHYATPEPPAQTGDTPPQDMAAEQLILGAAMIADRHLADASRHVTGPDFYRPNHETIWRALTALRGAGHPTSSTAVVAHLLDARELERAGGASYINTLEHKAVAVADVTHYAARVDSLARRRRAIEHLLRGLQRLRNPGPDHDVDDVLTTTTAELAEARDDLAGIPATTTWSPVDLDSVLSGQMLDPPPTMLARSDGVCLFYDGAVHTVSGESESGKTWLTLLAALQILEQGHRVVFVDFEDRADRVIARLLGLGATPTQIHDHFAYIRPDRPLDDDGRAQLAPALTGARLVILDGVTEAMTLHGYDLNSNADSALFQGLLPRWIADHGPAVVLIDHVVKNKEEQGRFAIGAQHKLAGIDGAAYVVKMIKPFARGARGLARVDVAKDRPGHVREHASEGSKMIAEFVLDSVSDVVLVATLSPPNGAGAPGAEDRAVFEPTVLMERVSRAVQMTPGLSKKSIEGVVTGKATHVRTALELLVARGYILAKAESRGRISHHHIKPYYQPGQDPDGDDATPSEERHLQAVRDNEQDPS